MIPVMIIPTLCQYTKLSLMLNSIDHEVRHIIVIDNGGELDRTITCPMADKVSVLTMPDNLGVPAAWNLGIKLTPYAPWWLVGSDDIVWNPGKLDMYVKAMDKKTMVADWSLDHAFSGFAFDELTIKEVGLFDDFYYPGVGEENNYMIRARHHGIKFRHIPGAYETKGGSTRYALNNVSDKANMIFAENWKFSIASNAAYRGWNLDRRRECDLECSEKLAIDAERLIPDSTN